VAAVYRICADGCKDPELKSAIGTNAFRSNKTDSSQQAKRQTFQYLQDAASPDLSFVSTPRGASINNYFKYDSSAGSRVIVFIIEPNGFDLNFPVS
jgi:hypothetical protein